MPRFGWVNTTAASRNPDSPRHETDRCWVLDLDAPGADSGEIKVFAETRGEARAKMMCMSLNGTGVTRRGTDA